MVGASRVFILLLCKKVICQITGPSQLTYFVGDNAHFRWNNTNTNPKMLSAIWGIKKGNIADPQFISVDIVRNKVYISSDLEPELMNRVSFDGDLKKGRAWFILKNVTINDTDEYLASISDDETMPLPYPVVLTVKEKEKIDERNELGVTGTQVNVSQDPGEPASSISKVVIIPIAVIFAVLFLVLAVAMVIICKKKRIKPERRGTNSSENKLMASA